MPLLSTNPSESLFMLLKGGKNQVDALELGPWCPLLQIEQIRQRLPGLPVYFHAGDLVNQVGLARSALPRFGAYLKATASPWISVHLTLWPPGLRALAARHGFPAPRPFLPLARRRLLWQVARLKSITGLPVLLENLEPFPTCDDMFNSQPALICDVLQKTGCGLLLDIAHARVAASATGMEVKDYLDRLPLECTMQVHVSGPRWQNDRLVDTHAPLQEEDYALLEHVLRRTQPQVVTLEYIRQPAPLQEQLARLREIIREH